MRYTNQKSLQRVKHFSFVHLSPTVHEKILKHYLVKNSNNWIEYLKNDIQAYIYICKLLLIKLVIR